MTVSATQPDAFGRSAAYMDSSSMFPSSYDHASADFRAGNPSSSVMSLHNQSQSDSPSLGSCSDTIPHPQAHYAPYASPTAHSNQTCQYQHHQHQYSHHHQHPHHPSAPHLGMQMPSDLTNPQSMDMHQTHQYGMHHHTDYPQTSLDAQRKAQQHRSEPAEPHTPRPPNAWILYRSQKFREIQQIRESQSRAGSSEKPKSQAEISRIISQMWQNETTEVKQKFEALADEKKLAHQRMYPTYRYRPKKKAKGGKQNATIQHNDQRQVSDGNSTKRETHGSVGGGYQDRYQSEGSTSTTYSPERKIGSDLLRAAPGQNMHDMAGRDPMARKTNYPDRRERSELQVPVNYGRSVSGSASSAEGHNAPSHGGNRMHPYGERPSSLMRQESPRTSEVFADASASNSSTYSNSHWSDSDANSGAYFDGFRSGSSAYAGAGNTRLPAASLISNNVGGSSLLSLSPTPRQSVPSQQLQHPIEHMESNLNLAEFTGAGSSAGYSNSGGGGGGSFRSTPMTNHAARFGPSFGGDSRSEVPSGLTVSGGNDGLSDSFDPHRRMQLP